MHVFSRALVLIGVVKLEAGRDVPFTCPPCSLDGDPPAVAMRTSRCSHLPGVPPECPPAPDGKALPAGTGSCPQYVMQVSTKDGQLLSSVVRTLATQRYVRAGGMGQAPSLRGLECPLPQLPPASPAGTSREDVVACVMEAYRPALIIEPSS